MSNRFDREDELERILAETARGVYSGRRNTEEKKTSVRETVNYERSKPAVKPEYMPKKEIEPEELVPVSGEKSVFYNEEYEEAYEEEAPEDYLKFMTILRMKKDIFRMKACTTRRLMKNTFRRKAGTMRKLMKAGNGL